ncbi:MAG TPA: metallophosphoesterase, partial [Longimicrobiales bacterium]|nr:metallophosphoesterase [Longimicrobiales bacterium]
MRKTALAAGAAAIVGTAFYAFLVEPRWLQVRRTRIHIPRLPAPLEGLRIGVLTDLHVDGRRSMRLVERAVRELMRHEPDLIALTGDFAERPPAQRQVLARLAGLSAPLGVYAVPGNHDYAAGIRSWRDAVDTHPRITNLTNRYALRERGGVRVCIAGVDDLEEGTPRLVLPPAAERSLTILLAHSPDQAERCRRRYDAVDLIVSGHTHGG